VVLFKTTVVYFLLSYTLPLHGQRPNYNFNWTDESFKIEAAPFFKQLTLQSGPILQVGHGREGRTSLKATISSGLSQATGTIPLFSGLYRISDNLWLGGLISGYRAGDDVIILSGYAAEILPGDPSEEGSSWSVEVSRRAVEGAEEFNFKTVGVTLSRRINSHHAEFFYGFGFSFYDVIFHGASAAVEGIPQRLEGQVNLLSGGVERSLGEFIVGLMANTSSKGASMMVYLSKLINE
jgi:hypothetical protein